MTLPGVSKDEEKGGMRRQTPKVQYSPTIFIDYSPEENDQLYPRLKNVNATRPRSDIL